MKAISAHLSNGVYGALCRTHALTGCDSTSAFVGHRKKAAFDLLSVPEWCQTTAAVRQQVPPAEELLVQCEKFVCALFGSPLSDVNEF